MLLTMTTESANLIGVLLVSLLLILLRQIAELKDLFNQKIAPYENPTVVHDATGREYKAIMYFNDFGESSGYAFIPINKNHVNTDWKANHGD